MSIKKEALQYKGKLEKTLARWKEEDMEKATDVQIGGDHYKNFKIQPYVFFHANQLPFHKSDIIKRIMRYDLAG